MDNIQKRYGYTGQGLRVNLTTGKITKEPTFPRFKDEIGGTALGYRVFWDEVPPKTQPLDEANKLVIAPGPFSGSGALCSSRTSITTIYLTIYPMPMIASAHIGGDMAARLKQAGYDFIIIEGKSEKPVYLYINNDEVELRDAKGIWGQGTRRAQQMLADQTSPMASIAVIGPAGENLVPMSVLISARQHSGGGVGSVFGSKKLKGVVIIGDQPIHIHADKKEWQKITVATSNRLLGQVVRRGAKAAGEHQQVAPLFCFVDEIRQTVVVVANGALALDGDAQSRQFPAEVLGVGVENVAEQQLGAHTDDLCCHGFHPSNST